MADPDLEAIPPTESAVSKASSPKADTQPAGSAGFDEGFDIDNVEKAQAIAEHDLHGPRKQVAILPNIFQNTEFNLIMHDRHTPVSLSSGSASRPPASSTVI